MVKKFLYILLSFFVFTSCFDSGQRLAYEIANTQWETQETEEDTGIPLLLEFSAKTVKISYGEPTPYIFNDMTFNYSPQAYQGSIRLTNFAFDTGDTFDVTWLFSIADNTQSMEIVIFKKSDENRAIVSLKRRLNKESSQN